MDRHLCLRYHWLFHNWRIDHRRRAVRTFDVRIFLALALFIAFGVFVTFGLAHFGPRELSAFWSVYFMVVYTLVGLWLGHAFVMIGLSVITLTLTGYFFAGLWFDLWMAVVNGGGLLLGGYWMRRA